jgi:hypothetical protein
MTTFVRRVPAEFDTTYWRVAEGYMERELGAVDATEAVRHESPKGFADTAGKVSGQRKDQPYCFAPYDGLRGLGMPDFHADARESVDVASFAGLGQMLAPAHRGAPIPLGEPPTAPAESPVLRAVPYVLAAVGLLWLFNKTAKETAPLRPAR